MDLRKLRDKATEAFSKGKFSKAAELYAEYCEKDPKDIQAKLRMGDAYAKAGDRAKAIVAYKAAAEAFAKEGFLPRAIAASKLILELDPSHTGVQQMLAGLYARKGGAPARRPTTQVEMPALGGAAARAKREPIELPRDESEAVESPRAEVRSVTPPPPPPSKYAPIELDPSDDALSVATTGASAVVPQGAVELPPELEVFTTPAAPARAPAPAPAPELVLELETTAPAVGEVEIPLDEPLNPAAVGQPVAGVPEEIELELTPEEMASPAAPSAASTMPSNPRPDAVARTTDPAGAAPAPAAPAAIAPTVAPAASLASSAPVVNPPHSPPTSAAAAPAQASFAPPGLKRRPTALEVPVEPSAPAPVAAMLSNAAVVPPASSSPQVSAAAAVPLPAPAVSAQAAVTGSSGSAGVAAPAAPNVAATPAGPSTSSAASTATAAASLQRASTSTAVPLPAPTAAAATPPAPASRIFIPGVAPVTPVAAPAGPKSAPYGKPTQSDLELALSRFDELSLDDAPFTPAPAVAAAVVPPQAVDPAPAVTAAAAVRVPSFTELELEGDSLLHAVEVAAIAGKNQRGEAAAEEEEEVFSLTAEISPEQKDAGELPKIPLFSDLPPDAFIELFERCPLKRFGANERIIAQGSVGDAFYVVCEGSVRVVRDEADGPRELATLNEGAFFGEMALLSGAPRSASVDSASEDTQLLEISAPVLAQLSVRYPSVASALKKFCRQRMLSNVMNTSALFRPFSKGDRRMLVEKFRARDVNKGDLLIKDGTQTDGLYIVLSGEVEVLKGNHVLARLHEGEIFGEMSLLKKTAASADVKASRRTSLIRLPRADFDALILSHPQILVLISELTDDRQRQNDAVVAGAAEIGEQGLMLV